MALKIAVATGPKELIVKGLLAVFFVQVIRFLYRGVVIRLQFHRLKAQGHSVPDPHSFLLGHLPLVMKLGASLPKDANEAYSTRDLSNNWSKYFPQASTAPSVVYLDLWPVASEPIAILRNGAISQQVVSGRFPPRHEQLKYLSRAVAGDRNLFEWDGDEHRLWRSRLNPGFSTRSLQMHIAKGKFVDEMLVFAERMKRSAGADGAWGQPFQMYPRAIDLTFDIICGVVLGFATQEQTNGPTEMQTALRTLGSEHFKMTSLKTLHKQLNPFWHLQYYRCHSTLRRILLPHIQKALDTQKSVSKDPSALRTVVDLALKEIQEESAASKSQEDFIEDVIGLTKLFTFAGHDTTAISLSFAIYYLSKRPDFLQQIRDEHDEVFGTDPSRVASLLRESPQLLASLPYTRAAIKETLRLTAIAGSLRTAPPNFVLSDPGTGTQYPTNGFVLVSSPRNLHYDATIWPRADEFLPERWIVGDDDPLHAPTEGHLWRPFELGPMSCIGQELAMMELHMALLFTMRECEFEAALEDWDAMQGRKGTRPTVDGDNIYHSNESPLGPPVEGLPMRVRLRARK